MCGIAGIFHRTAPQAQEDILARMQDAISHRGPDGRGTWCSRHASIAHVRLAILDIHRGKQPMTTRDGRFVITYNGEIYNFKELRERLKGLGCSFTTDSDTEVLNVAWSVWGERCLGQLNGMFAFAIWDEQQKEGFLVRDPFGIKPLFYFLYKDMLFFASEAKAILKALAQIGLARPGIDMQALHMLMNFRYLPGEMGLWKGIRQLRPGWILRWGLDIEEELRQWAEIPGGAESSMTNLEDEKELHGTIARSIEHAVKSQLVSDVEVGGYLSYGIDSGIITSIAASELRKRGYRYPTFTIDTGDSPFEAKGAKESARYFDVPNIQKKIHDIHMEERMRWLIWHIETPKVNALQASLVAELASQYVKVALSGLGGDEVFLGYNIHRLFNQYTSYINHAPVRTIMTPFFLFLKDILRMFSPYSDELSRACALMSSRSPTRAYGILRNVWDGLIPRSAIYGPRLLDESHLLNPFEYIEEHWTHPPSPNTSQLKGLSHLKRLQLYELREKMVNDFLWNEDRVSMGYGLEVRVPFLDVELVKLVVGLSTEVLLCGGRLKGLLKDVAKRWLPKEVLSRPKSGFQVPIHVFFEQHLRGLCDVYLNEARVREQGLFNYEFIKRILKARPCKQLRWHYFMVYLMLGMSIWMEVFEEG